MLEQLHFETNIKYSVPRILISSIEGCVFSGNLKSKFYPYIDLLHTYKYNSNIVSCQNCITFIILILYFKHTLTLQ